jgi:hypothetical protein
MQPVNSSPTADPKGKPSSELPPAVSQAVSEAMRDQKKRQERLRHVQEFLTSPVFIDMKDQPLLTSSAPQELLERRNDLKYRINVMESMLGMLIEELDMLERVIGDQAKSAAPSPAPRAESAES